MSSKADRTEKPTGRRLRDARRKGQLPRSRDLGQACSLAAVVLVLGWQGVAFIEGLGSAVATGLTRMGQHPTQPVEFGDAVNLAVAGAITLGTLVGPIAATVAITVIAIHTAQGGWNVASEAIAFDWKRLNPAAGIKRLGFSQGGVETIKMLVVVTVLAVLAVQAVKTLLADSARLAGLDPMQAALVGWDDARRLLRQAALVLGVFAVADYGVQRWRFSSSMKMTKQEVKDDRKMDEGNPEIKSRVRRIQREMFRKRMLAATRTATLVVTNPTHYAVALEYRRQQMVAPRVVAKGKELLAQRIKEIAREHGVPIVENPPLAQALYKGVEVGEVIPSALFEAVAEVLAYLIRLKQLVLT